MIDVGTIIYMHYRNEYHFIYEINKNHFYTRLITPTDTGGMSIASNMNVYPLSHIDRHTTHTTHTQEQAHMDIVVGNIYRKCVGKGDYIVLIGIDNLGTINGVGHTHDFYKFSYLDVSTGVKGEIILLKKDFSLYFEALSQQLSYKI
jgi:hypothetical protein